jgi:dipeptidyl aminopeptidase/acylaminoacyl peptidase
MSMSPRSRLFVFALLSLSLAGAQTDVVRPPENLVTQGIPAIPRQLVRQIERYTNYHDAFLQSWHPMRLEMLISTRSGNTRQIHLVSKAGAAGKQLTSFPDAVGGAQYEPSSGRFFVFSKDTGGDEFYQLYRYDFADQHVTLLTDGKSRNTGAVFSRSGKHLAYGSTRRNGKDVDLYVMDPSNPRSDHLVAQLEGGGWIARDWSPDEHQVLVSEEISVNESYLWLINVDTGEKKLVTPKTESLKVSTPDGRFSADGNALYVVTDRDSEFQRLARVELKTGATRYLTAAIPWDVEEFDLSRDGKKLAFITNEDGNGVLHILDTASEKEVRVPRLPAGRVSGVLWHRDSRVLGFGLVSAQSPFDVYGLDTQSGKIQRWTTSDTGGVNTADLHEPELIHWKSFDDRTISGFLYRPAGKATGKLPVIVNIHGGPEGQSRPGFLGRNNYYLKELGIAILYPNVRGSTGYGKTFSTLDNGFLREDSYKDINSLLDWIQTQPDLDSSRVMITGGSYGGFMTLAVATTYNDRICCSVEIVGISNLVTFLEHTSGYRQDLRRVEYGDERDPKMREFLERIAPANKAKNITKPLFVLAGKNDPRVPASESEQMVDIVRRKGTPVWYLLAKDEGHGFSKKQNQDFQFYSTIMFVKQFLLK